MTFLQRKRLLCAFVFHGRRFSPFPRSFEYVHCSLCTQAQSQMRTDQRRPASASKKLFHALKAATRANGVNMDKFDIIEFNRNLPSFTDEDWRRHLAGFGTMKRSNFPTGQDEVMSKARTLASEWMLENLFSVAPIDYFNFLGFLARFSRAYRDRPLDTWILNSIREWFDKHFDSLEPDAFFDILLRLTHFQEISRLGRDSIIGVETLPSVIDRGVELAKNADLYEILGLMFTINFFGSVLRSRRFFTFAARESLFVTLCKRKGCVDVEDLLSSLLFLSDSEKRNPYNCKSRIMDDFGTAENIPAWRWLHRSIDAVFADDNLNDLRTSGAVAAIRAFRAKTIETTANDVGELLQTAADPYLTDPTLIFKLRDETEAELLPHYLCFNRLMTALHCALKRNDIGKNENLSVRLDDAYWHQVFSSLRVEAPKLVAAGETFTLQSIVGMFRRTMNAMKVNGHGLTNTISSENGSLVISSPVTPERQEILQQIEFEYSLANRNFH